MTMQVVLVEASDKWEPIEIKTVDEGVYGVVVDVDADDFSAYRAAKQVVRDFEIKMRGTYQNVTGEGW